jgi:hypothetical protein
VLSQQIHKRDPCQTEFLGGLAGGNLATGKQGQDGFLTQVFLESRHYCGVGGDVEFNLQFHGTVIVSRTGLMTIYGVVESGAARLMRMRTPLGFVDGEGGRRAWGCDRHEVGAMDVFEVERRARAGSYRLDLGVAHFQVLHVAEKEALRGSRVEHARLGVHVLALGHLNLGRIRSRAADVLHVDVGKLDVFDGATPGP